MPTSAASLAAKPLPDATLLKTKPLIEFSNLTLGYERHPAVHHLEGRIEQGDLLALVGPNGGGKSTLLRGIMQEIRPLGGEILWPLGRPKIAYLPQRASLNLDFPISVADFVSLGHWPKLGAFLRANANKNLAIEQALEQVGLAGFNAQPLNALSGGQLQRVLFARLLLEGGDLILLDEPFTAVDAATTADLLELIQTWHQQGLTLITVLHDLHQAREFFPKSLLLAKEALAWGASKQVLTPENLARARQTQVLADPFAPACELD